MIRVRIKFTKHGPIKYLGHLDVMRYFQKAIRRAHLDVKYSEGYHPHQLLGFAQPLGVGITSDGEYLDMTLNTLPEGGLQGVLQALNDVMHEGIEVIKIMELTDTKDKAMTRVAAAAYTVRFREGHAPASGWEEALVDFCSANTISIMKRSKKGEKETDIKPMIHEVLIMDDTICLILTSGNEGGLRPELLLHAFLQSRGMEATPATLIVHRLDTYQEGVDDEGRYFEPLIPDGSKFYREDPVILYAKGS